MISPLDIRRNWPRASQKPALRLASSPEPRWPHAHGARWNWNASHAPERERLGGGVPVMAEGSRGGTEKRRGNGHRAERHQRAIYQRRPWAVHARATGAIRRGEGWESAARKMVLGGLQADGSPCVPFRDRASPDPTVRDGTMAGRVEEGAGTSEERKAGVLLADETPAGCIRHRRGFGFCRYVQRDVMHAAFSKRGCVENGWRTSAASLRPV